MKIRSRGRLCAASLCAIAASTLSFSTFAGDGAGCPKQAALIDAEGGANGQINASDHAADAQKRFEAMDADHDGKVTAAELTASHGAERIDWARKPMSGADKIRTFDRNKDDTLSAKEYAEGSQALFNALDIDGDGILKGAELDVNTDTVSASDAH